MFKMKYRVVFGQLFHILLFARIELNSSVRVTEYTLPIQDRIAILKSKIAAQINQFPNKELPIEEEGIDENVEYEDHDNDPITPINERDRRKKKDIFKLKQIKTTRAISHQPVSLDRNVSVRHDDVKEVTEHEKSIPRISNTGKERIQPIVLNKKKHKVNKSKVTDVFYRRINPSGFLNSLARWTHCQDLITPFLTGQKSNVTVKLLAVDDHVVLRLLQLLAEDMTDHSKDDITSILYQISNLQLRLFQWEEAAIKLLLDVIYKGKMKRHTFKTIKFGLKNMFDAWNLDVGSNITVLLKQTRLFRPPCVMITTNEGSTKTSKTIHYSKKPKKKCSNDKC